MDTIKNTNGDEFQMIGNWSRQAELLKEKFFELTDTDLIFEAGKELELLSRIKKRLHKNLNEVISILRRLQPMPATVDIKN